MNSHPPSDASIFTSSTSVLLAMGDLLGPDHVTTGQKLLLYRSPTTRRLLRFIPGKAFPAVDTIEPGAWMESVDIDLIEDMLESFEPAAAHILRVIDHKYLDELLGHSSAVWQRWLVAHSLDSGPPAGPTQSWYRAGMRLLHPEAPHSEPEAQEPGGDRDPPPQQVVSIGPGFMEVAASRGADPPKRISSLLSMVQNA